MQPLPAGMWKARFADALAELGKPRAYGYPQWYWSYMAYVCGRSGQRAQAQRALARLELFARRSPSDLTLPQLIAYVGADRKDEVIALLQKAYSEHSVAVVTLKVEPYYDPLRGDPRFQDLLRRVALADSNTAAKSTPKP